MVARPAGRSDQAAEHPHGGRFARAVRAEESKDGAARDFQREAFDRPRFAVSLAQILQMNDRFAHFEYSRRKTAQVCQRRTMRIDVTFMEMKTRHFLSCLPFALALLLASALPLRADAVSEMKSFSVFDTVDLATLAQGDAKAVRGAPMSTSRFLSVQSAWVSPGTPAQVAAALRRWTPAGHSELKVLLHNGGSNFSKLSQAPNNSAVQALVSATASKSPELQISRAEAAKLPAAAAGSTMSGAVANFWSGVLSGRAQAFASGGLSGAAALRLQRASHPSRRGDQQRSSASREKFRNNSPAS